MKTDLNDLWRRIEKLSARDRLVVAALCIDEGKYDIAEALSRRVADELSALRLLNPAERNSA